jgi:hypothetical protein
MMTERAEFTFVAKESATGAPFVAAEPVSDMPKTIRAVIGFDLKAGTTLKEAHEIAAYLRSHIRGVSVTF